MKSRERVLRILNHQEADRIPIDFGGTIVSSIHAIANDRLKQYLGINAPPEPVIDQVQGIVAPCEEILKQFKVDFRRVALRPSATWRPTIFSDGSFIDEYGVHRRKAGYYYDIIEYPLAHAETISDIEKHSWPDPYDPSRVAGLTDEVRDLYENSDYALIGDMFMGGIFEQCIRVRGYEQFLVDMMINQSFAEALLDKFLELYLGFYDVFLKAAGKYLQIIALADDLGMQDRTLISPTLYRKIVKPRHKKLYQYIKSHTDAKILHHSCGAIFPLIDDLIEVGVDILNPIQTSAVNMDLAIIKEKYGDHLVFHGCIDIQQILPSEETSKVEQEVARVIKIMAPGGGFILAPGHNIQPDTKPENIVALFRAACKYGAY